MQLKKVEITELVGVNRNAVEGVAQTAPVEIKGFNLGEAGGYYANFSQESTSILAGLSTSVISHDEFGLALFEDSRILYNGAVSDQSSGSIAPLRQYIVPKVGVATDPLVSGSDAYLIGAFIKDSTEHIFRDPPRATGVTVTTSGTATGMPNATLRTLTYFFAPTPEGFVAYESYAEDHAAASNQGVLVTADAVLPTGFLMKSYLGTKDDPKFYLETSGSSTVPTRDDYSDGATSMSVFFDDYVSASSPTIDAFIGYCGNIACVEPHQNRVYGKASLASLTGPFVYGYNPDSFFQTNYFEESTTTNVATWNSAFNNGTEFAIRVYRGMYQASVDITAPSSSLPDFTDTRDFYFANRIAFSVVSQFAVGIRLAASYTEVKSSYDINIDAEWVVIVNGSATTIPIKTLLNKYRITKGETKSIDLAEIVLGERADFIVDLTASTLQINFYDSGGNLFDSDSSGSVAGGGTLSNLAAYALDVGYRRSSSTAYTQVTAHNFNFEGVWFYSDAAMSTKVAQFDAGDWDGTSTTLTSTSPTGETWTVDSVNITLVPGSLPDIAQVDPDTTIVYSDIGFVNWGTVENYVKIPFTTSTKITALRSTPAGLVVFGENEAFLFRGDPIDDANFAVQRFAGTLGCDEGVRPARLGGHIFTIWKGRLFAIALGMGDVDFGSGLTEIGQPIWDPEDPFVQVVGEPRTRHLIARTQGGSIYRYSTDVGQWLTDPWDDVSGLNYLLPNVDSVGTRYVINGDAYQTVLAPEDPTVKWENIDLGDKGMKKLWRRVRLFTSDDYSGTPELNYVIGSSSGTITASEEGSGWWVFTLPNGLVSEKAASLEVVMKGAAFGDEFEPPVIIEYVDRYSRR